MEDKIIAVPQQEFLDAIEMLEEYRKVCKTFETRKSVKTCEPMNFVKPFTSVKACKT